jgi:hypothetical protein
MSFRNQCIAVVALGVASLVLGSWFLGEHAPNVLVLLIGALLLAIVATQGMLVVVLMLAHRRERARAQDPSS